MQIKLSLVVPCFNEEGNVQPFFATATAALQGYTTDYEIIFVDDGSTDGTANALATLVQQNPAAPIKVVRFSRNFGKEAAMLAGLKESKGAYVTLIDADLQQHPSVAVQMAKILDESPQYDMVAAFQKDRQEPAFLRWCKRRFYGVINAVSEVKLIPNASDFRTLRRVAVEALLHVSEYHRFSKGLFSFVGFESASIPYEVQARESGQSKWNFFKLMRYAISGIIAYTDLPLKLPLYFGALCLIFALLWAPVLAICSMLGLGPWSIGWVLWAVLVATGILSCFMGVMGLYLGQVHTQVKGRPIYITKEIYGYDQDQSPVDKI